MSAWINASIPLNARIGGGTANETYMAFDEFLSVWRMVDDFSIYPLLRGDFEVYD